jgi:hypothetical protein
MEVGPIESAPPSIALSMIMRDRKSVEDDFLDLTPGDDSYFDDQATSNTSGQKSEQMESHTRQRRQRKKQQQTNLLEELRNLREENKHLKDKLRNI